MDKTSHADRGSIGGRATTQAKAAAARENGRRGGRPGDPRIKAIMAERGVSRQRAHKILAFTLSRTGQGGV